MKQRVEQSAGAAAASALPRKPMRPRWQERGARLLVRLLARLPIAVLHGLGSVVGRLIASIPNRQRRNALINIALHSPDRPAAELVRARNRSLRELGKTLFETALLWMRPPAAAVGLIRDVRNGELLQRQAGRGLIVLSPHIGAWELAGLYLSTQGPTTIFYKPQRLLDDLIVDARRRAGATLAPITARGIRVLLNALERGEYAGILPDQERRSGAPVIFMIAERLPRAQGFRIHCLPAPEGIDSDDDVEAAAALNRGIEQCIAICPDQYLWSYRRFRRRPSGGRKVYTGPLRDRFAIDRARHLQSGQG
jgi:KDO2-lipid IV(A) lauroyltransferase